MEITTVRDRLIDSLEKTVAAFDWPDDTLARAYASGKWSARRLLVHLTDCELLLQTRLKHLLADDRPTVPAMDPDAWAAKFRYPEQDLSLVRETFVALRRALLPLAEHLTVADLARPGTHPEVENFTAGRLLEHIADHSDHHLSQLEAIRDGKRWAR